MTFKVLISDKLSEKAVAVFEKYPDIEVDFDPGLGKEPERLLEKIKDADAIAIRSATKLTAEVLEHANNLKVIGRAGIGVDNVDIPVASQRGIVVMNTPTGNMITTAEHAISMLCSVSRNIPQATASMKSGKWEKSKFMGSELHAKTLGVVGCGNIGREVAKRALGLKMKVLGFDPFLSAQRAQELGIEKAELSEIFSQADYITVHTPLNDKTKGLLNKAAFEKMKKGVYVINCARGGIIDEKDLQWALEENIVAGAALDVFETEPVDPEHPLLKSDRVICTPHLGGSTDEAQENVAVDVADQIGNFLSNGVVVNSLNAPSASKEVVQALGAYIPLCEKLGSWLGQLCEESPTKIQINYYGELIKNPLQVLTTAVLQGVLQPVVEEGVVNSVNAPHLAKERGIEVQESKFNSHSDYTALIEVFLETPSGSQRVAGTVFGKGQEKIVGFDDVHPEINPRDTILIIENNDKPGVLGKIGTFLGDQNVNINQVQLELISDEGKAVAFYHVDQKADQSVIDNLLKVEGVLSVRVVNF